jgi:hypothetical protein
MLDITWSLSSEYCATSSEFSFGRLVSRHQYRHRRWRLSFSVVRNITSSAIRSVVHRHHGDGPK